MYNNKKRPKSQPNEFAFPFENLLSNSQESGKSSNSRLLFSLGGEEQVIVWLTEIKAQRYKILCFIRDLCSSACS